MINRYIYILGIMLLGLLVSCDDNNIDKNNSIFPTDPPERSEFDVWLLNNMINPYNMDIKYRMEDIESDMGFELAPAELKKSYQMAQLIKFLWVEAYEEAVDPEFTRTYIPRIIHLIGSLGWNNNNTMVLGTAQGGLKVTLYDINRLVLDSKILHDKYFHTMHHEFAHVLHQTKNYDPNFQLITEGDYVGSNWYQPEFADPSAGLGFVSPYARHSPNEDFVEIYSRFITQSPAQWQALLTKAGPNGTKIINEKFELVQLYFENEWGIDIFEMRDIIHRRSSEMQMLELLEFDKKE